MIILANWPRWTVVLVAMSIGSCVAIPDIPKPSPTPPFSALSFFKGRTFGEGRLKILFNKPRSVAVRSYGRIDDQGKLILDQHITEVEKPPTHREWVIRETSPGAYAATLSDASGPVTGSETGNRLHLQFRMKGGLAANQWLTLQPGGRDADNVMVVRKFGLPVAVLHETIRKDE